MEEKSIALSKLLVHRGTVMLKDEEPTLFMVALWNRADHYIFML